MSTIRKHIKEQVAALPHSPGVYQFIDRNDKIIYVGKAKDLRKRVSSYFVENRDHSAKVIVLVKQIVANVITGVFYNLGHGDNSLGHKIHAVDMRDWGWAAKLKLSGCLYLLAEILGYDR